MRGFILFAAIFSFFCAVFSASRGSAGYAFMNILLFGFNMYRFLNYEGESNE